MDIQETRDQVGNFVWSLVDEAIPCTVPLLPPLPSLLSFSWASPPSITERIKGYILSYSISVK